MIVMEQQECYNDDHPMHSSSSISKGDQTAQIFSDFLKTPKISSISSSQTESEFSRSPPFFHHKSFYSTENNNEIHIEIFKIPESEEETPQKYIIQDIATDDKKKSSQGEKCIPLAAEQAKEKGKGNHHCASLNPIFSQIAAKQFDSTDNEEGATVYNYTIRRANLGNIIPQNTNDDYVLSAKCTNADIINVLRGPETKNNDTDSDYFQDDTKIKLEDDYNVSDTEEVSSLLEEDLPNIQELTAIEETKDERYRKTCEIFRQHLPCFKLQDNSRIAQCTLVSSLQDVQVDNVSKCRECRARSRTRSQSTEQHSKDIYCRFLDFRCLQYTEDGLLKVTGFPNPYIDCTRDDLNIWQPDANTEPTCSSMSVQTCRYILLHIGDQFCYLWRQEAEALKLNENHEKPIAWKRQVLGIREICDVCDTTLFNFHWTCEVCGFGVCIDCYRDHKSNVSLKRNALRKDCDDHFWLFCSPGVKHELSALVLTQIIAGDALNILGRRLHEIRTFWDIPQRCECLLSTQRFTNFLTRKRIRNLIKKVELKEHLKKDNRDMSSMQKHLYEFHQPKFDWSKNSRVHLTADHKQRDLPSMVDAVTLARRNLRVVRLAVPTDNKECRRFVPPRSMSSQASMLMAPDVPHEWLCDGKLLRLIDPRNPNNLILFQEVWQRGQPVMISEVSQSLNLNMWHPESFLLDFGDEPNDLINCLTGNLVPNQPMRYFWEGFLSMDSRLQDANGQPMLLKLKDWPPGDDFAEILPHRFDDLMKGLPMADYTLRIGHLNLASCLPKMFVPPDLGPKMYNAYGSALYPEKGTTNLHLDISDAVNIMVYVGIPEDSEIRLHHAASQLAITKGGCEYLTRAKLTKKDVIPGALWHIFPACDADKIRDFLNKETLEKGFRLDHDHDPIHDQNWYLDDDLREKLFLEYGVQGYPIVQCLGDAVFIPAGAPHQVQNLHNCIKVAEDFVSPENISHCYHLTQQFRRLSHSHTNHEDKLQIKNIIYHAVKDCCTILYRAFDPPSKIKKRPDELVPMMMKMRILDKKRKNRT